MDNQEHYSFLIPVVKALLEKLSVILGLASHLPDLPQTQAGPAFFDDFQSYCQGAQWKTFMEKKVGHFLCFLICCGGGVQFQYVGIIYFNRIPGKEGMLLLVVRDIFQ